MGTADIVVYVYIYIFFNLEVKYNVCSKFNVTLFL